MGAPVFFLVGYHDLEPGATTAMAGACMESNISFADGIACGDRAETAGKAHFFAPGYGHLTPKREPWTATCNISRWTGVQNHLFQ